MLNTMKNVYYTKKTSRYQYFHEIKSLFFGVAHIIVFTKTRKLMNNTLFQVKYIIVNKICIYAPCKCN